MYGKLDEIAGIVVRDRAHPHNDDQGRGDRRPDIQDMILGEIRTIAGKNSIMQHFPVQSRGDHKTQDIVFSVDDTEYLATLRYNNAMTEGRVEGLSRRAKKC